MQSQLLGPNFSLPNKVSELVRKIDLRVWIQKGVEKLWEKIKAKVPGTTLGRQLTDKVGDPIWVAQDVYDKNRGKIYKDGVPLTDMLASWKIAQVANPSNIALIDAFAQKVDAFAKSEWVQAVIKAAKDRDAARMKGTPTHWRRRTRPSWLPRSRRRRHLHEKWMDRF